MLEITNLGWANSDSLQFSLVKRQSNGYQYRVAYTLSTHLRQHPSPGAIETITTQVARRPEPRARRGTDDAGSAARAVGRPASAEIPKTRGSSSASGSFQYQSGAPFTLTDSTIDPNRNGQFQEALPAGTYSGAAGNPDAFTVENIGGFRGARGPESDGDRTCAPATRSGWAGSRSLQAYVDVFNVTNRANFNNPNGDRRDTATFLILRSVVNPTRTAQFNLK